MHSDPAGPPEPSPDPSDRRDALRKIGVGAAVAWTAPLVLSAGARAAATVAPPPDPCTACGTNIVPNPDADDGTTGWVDIAPSITSVGQYSPAFPSPLPAASPNFFSVAMPDGFNNYVINEFTIPLACGGRTWTFSAYVSNLQSPVIRPELCFCDADHFALDDVIIAEVTNAPQMVLVQGTGTVPVGTVFVGIQMWIESQDDADGIGRFDHLSFDISCA